MWVPSLADRRADGAGFWRRALPIDWGRRKAERVHKNEAAFKQYSERRKGFEAPLAGTDDLTPFVCECGDAGCYDGLPLTIADSTKRMPRRGAMPSSPGTSCLTTSGSSSNAPRTGSWRSMHPETRQASAQPRAEGLPHRLERGLSMARPLPRGSGGRHPRRDPSHHGDPQVVQSVSVLIVEGLEVVDVVHTTTPARATTTPASTSAITAARPVEKQHGSASSSSTLSGRDPSKTCARWQSRRYLGARQAGRPVCLWCTGQPARARMGSGLSVETSVLCAITQHR